MVKLLQRFDLDIEAMNVKAPLTTSSVGETLRNELLSKNYVVLESNEFRYGLPISIILYGEGMNHKKDFYEVVERLGVGNYYSECFYTINK